MFNQRFSYVVAYLATLIPEDHNYRSFMSTVTTTMHFWKVFLDIDTNLSSSDEENYEFTKLKGSMHEKNN